MNIKNVTDVAAGVASFVVNKVGSLAGRFVPVVLSPYFAGSVLGFGITAFALHKVSERYFSSMPKLQYWTEIPWKITKFPSDFGAKITSFVGGVFHYSVGPLYTQEQIDDLAQNAEYVKNWPLEKRNTLLVFFAEHSNITVPKQLRRALNIPYRKNSLVEK